MLDKDSYELKVLAIEINSEVKKAFGCSGDKGRVQKPESRVSSVRGGGVPPLSANFFPLVFPSAMGAGGVPPLSANFFSVSF